MARASKMWPTYNRKLMTSRCQNETPSTSPTTTPRAALRQRPRALTLLPYSERFADESAAPFRFCCCVEGSKGAGLSCTDTALRAGAAMKFRYAFCRSNERKRNPPVEHPHAHAWGRSLHVTQTWGRSLHVTQTWPLQSTHKNSNPPSKPANSKQQQLQTFDFSQVM
jgi:hypothetical protein